MRRFVLFTIAAVALLVALSFQAMSPSLSAALQVITVINLNDSGPGSLRQAIEDAESGTIITFAPGLKGTIVLSGGGFRLYKSLTIIGPGPKSDDLIIDGNNNAQIFSIYPNVALSFSNLTLTKATAGVLENDQGIVTISNTTFNDNIAKGAAAISSSGLVTVTGSTFQKNRTDIGDASAVANGGIMTIFNSTFQDNTTDVTFDSQGTPIFPHEAVFNSGILTIVNSTFRGNTLKGHPTIKNVGGIVNLENTVIQGSAEGLTCEGPITDRGNNLQFPGNDCGASIPVGDPKLGPLADNGGPTWTIALMPGSAAIGKVNKAACPTADQRGKSLDANSMCDIGAFQSSAFPMQSVAMPSPTTPIR